MRRLFVVTVASMATAALVPDVASADYSDCSRKLERSYSKRHHQVENRLGTRAPGRNIRERGVLYISKVRRNGKKRYIETVFDATCGEIRRSLRQLKKLLISPPYSYSKAVPPPQPPAGVMADQTAASLAGGGSSNSMVDPNCESGGDPSINTGNGYYGKYQFDLQTWAAHGGPPGLPSDHPEWVQDQVAARVNYDAWPNC
jgi:hypothetical protein